MNICTVSPFCCATKEEILDFLGRATADLVLLPGNLPDDYEPNMPSPREIQRNLQTGVSVFAENSGGKMQAIPCIVTKKEIRIMPKQIFGNKPSANDVDRLILTLPKRTFCIADRSVIFLICGELIAFNPDGSVKHNREIQYNKYDILANPGHTLMGHWNHLGSKLKTLSKKGPIVLYTTNNTKNHKRITTDTRIYKKGNLLNNRNLKGTITSCECEI